MEEFLLKHDIIKHAHGITRTLVDLIIDRNKEDEFRSNAQVIKFIDSYIDRLRRNGDGIFKISYQTFCLILNEENVFQNDSLNCATLYEKTLSYESFVKGYERAYELCCREKIYNIIAYLNAYRHYKNPKDILKDLEICGLAKGMPLLGGKLFPCYIVNSFFQQRWNEVAPNGVLDNDILMDLMFNEFERDVKLLGLQDVIRTKYVEFSECHPNVRLPKMLGYGPAYVLIADNKYSRACSKGLFAYNSMYEDSPFLYERGLLFKILDKDPKYVHAGNYYVPKYNINLPIFEIGLGELKFKNKITKFAKILFVVVTRGVF